MFNPKIGIYIIWAQGAVYKIMYNQNTNKFIVVKLYLFTHIHCKCEIKCESGNS